MYLDFSLRCFRDWHQSDRVINTVMMLTCRRSGMETQTAKLTAHCFCATVLKAEEEEVWHTAVTESAKENEWFWCTMCLGTQHQRSIYTVCHIFGWVASVNTEHFQFNLNVNYWGKNFDLLICPACDVVLRYSDFSWMLRSLSGGKMYKRCPDHAEWGLNPS